MVQAAVRAAAHPESARDHEQLVIDALRGGLVVATRAERAVVLGDEDAQNDEVAGPRVRGRRHRATSSKLYGYLSSGTKLCGFGHIY